jgi:hypothetical protein
MNFKSLKASVLLLTILLSSFLISTSFADSNSNTPNFQAQFEVLSHKLYVSILPSVYNYFGNLTHEINSDADYAKLITPQSVEPIAECILNKTAYLPNHDEQFADAVLSLVHEIPYKVTDAAYPVETLVQNSADCVGLSLLAASIMKAGGLDVVLIHYVGIDPGHMNVGVYLQYTPAYHTLLMTPKSFEYNNKTYWTAEATAKMDWKVGDQSDTVANAQAEIIPLANTENNSPLARVSARLDYPLVSSSVSLTLSQQPLVDQNNSRALVISGYLLPAEPNKDITFYIYHNGACIDCSENFTDSYGGFFGLWNLTQTGTYYVTASWCGDSKYAGADSETLAVFVGPEFLVQFQTPEYNYIFGHDGLANYELRPYLGINDFLSIHLGTNVSFSYDFMVLPTGHEPSNVQTQTITVPARELSMRGAGRQSHSQLIPERTFVVPTSVPQGLEPLSLPDDFNQTINNQFCLTLQSNSADNYSLNFQGLSGYDLANMLNNQGNTVFVNVTDNLIENTWYRISSVISMNAMATKLEDANGTVISSKATSYAAGNTSMILLIANNVDNAVSFKDLNIQTLNTPIQTPESSPKPTINQDEITFYIIIMLLLAGTLAVAAAFYVKKPKLLKRKD